MNFAERIKQVLQNPIYLGHLVQMRTTNISYKNKKITKRDPEDMIWVYNTHEAIVSQELWDKCREMEASVSQGKKNRTGFVNPLSVLCTARTVGRKCTSNTTIPGIAGKDRAFITVRIFHVEPTHNLVSVRAAITISS